MKSTWRNIVFVLMSVAPLAFSASCSSDDGGTTGGGPTDSNPPAITSVTPLDMNHIEILFDEDLNKDSAERDENYTIVEQAPTPNREPMNTTSPGDTLSLASSILKPDKRTVIITTWDVMSSAPYNVTVRDVADVSGNRITVDATGSFVGVATPDNTAPEIVFRSPGPNATGIGTAQSVVIQFSEPMDWNSVLGSFSWTRTGGSVPFSMEEQGDNQFVFSPLQAMSTNTLHTVSVSATAQDFAGNSLVATNWDFTTTPTTDTTPPSLVSSIPTDGATYVSANVVFRFTFSEPVDPNELFVITSPDIGDGIVTWTNDGASVTFDPDVPLLANTSYQMIIPPGGVRDLSGNIMTDAVAVGFTTGAALPTGGFAGTLTGDPNSPTASNPAGTMVLAATGFPSDPDWAIAGAGFCTPAGTYSVNRMPDGTYFPIGFMDSNGDGELDPSRGDAVGAYGVDFTQGASNPLSVTIVNGTMRTGISFPMYDPLAIVGSVIYTGNNYAGIERVFYVSAWDTAGFDTTGGLPAPDYSTDGRTLTDVEFAISEFDDQLADGTYFIGAFLDGNDNGFLDAGEPANILGAGGNWTPVTVTNGQDALGVDIMLDDTMTAAASSRAWGSASIIRGKRVDGRSQLAAMIRAVAVTYGEGRLAY